MNYKFKLVDLIIIVLLGLLINTVVSCETETKDQCEIKSEDGTWLIYSEIDTVLFDGTPYDTLKTIDVCNDRYISIRGISYSGDRNDIFCSDCE